MPQGAVSSDRHPHLFKGAEVLPRRAINKIHDRKQKN